MIIENPILINEDDFNKVKNSQGIFFHKLIKSISPESIAEDLLNPKKSILQGEILQKYINLEGKRVLEIGSGLGINHIVWTKNFKANCYGIEPSEEGFNSSFEISKELIKNNGLDESKIINAFGENIPFDDNYFDILYSTNVLEHVSDPEKVLNEAMRVLKPGGILQIIYPNYHSFFDGHYGLFHPPVLFKSFFPWYVGSIFNRDPAFAKTLRTELNVFWTYKILKRLKKTYNFEVLSLGEDVFMERITNLNFEAWGSLKLLKSILEKLHKLKITFFIGIIMRLFRSWTPIILTVRKL
jgi:ubiquinone/menaquinone biosynthesis C-methylase UbiE